jgi:RNA polymerase sigma-70 factor (ECF subfamily)
MSTATVFSAATKQVTQEFEEIFREHYLLVYRTAFSVTGNPQDAEDVLQNIFLWVLRRGMPPGLKDSKAYLYRAAVNASLNVVRSRRREISINDDVGDVEQARVHTDTPAVDHAADIQSRLVDAMGQLHPRSVEMLILRYEHNYSDAEIGKLLGTSRGVVAVTLHRARARLRRLLRSQMEKSHET